MIKRLLSIACLACSFQVAHATELGGTEYADVHMNGFESLKWYKRIAREYKQGAHYYQVMNHKTDTPVDKITGLETADGKLIPDILTMDAYVTPYLESVRLKYGENIYHEMIDDPMTIHANIPGFEEAVHGFPELTVSMDSIPADYNSNRLQGFTFGVQGISFPLNVILNNQEGKPGFNLSSEELFPKIAKK
ncbi:hypothetical protein [Komagataeibacter nataicola]|nr:hypothetical protein [Komagataeibacter nataicola]WNM10291.1 hypothetical protein RI056_18500 [Komagataeibacter nataicola]GBR23444.1 hypothetical protein AA0616_2524 [Komagataeibacter nataicola NRIC 0616]